MQAIMVFGRIYTSKAVKGLKPQYVNLYVKIYPKSDKFIILIFFWLLYEIVRCVFVQSFMTFLYRFQWVFYDLK